MRPPTAADSPADASTLGSVIENATQRLFAAGIETADREARWLIEHALGLTGSSQLVDRARLLHAQETAKVDALVTRRAAREPLQYILETQEFCGLDFHVNSAVLIPRPETELLVQEVLREGGFSEGAVLVDVGTGSGCVAITLATILSGMRIFALDCSGNALTVAKENAKRHGVGDKITWKEGDLLSPLHECKLVGAVDAIVSNPPYIAEGNWNGLQPEVRDFEPRLALVAGQS